jgi:DNA-binding transcriptional regulator YiaG
MPRNQSRKDQSKKVLAKSLATILYNHRKNAKLSQEKFAELLDRYPEQVRNWEQLAQDKPLFKPISSELLIVNLLMLGYSITVNDPKPAKDS